MATKAQAKKYMKEQLTANNAQAIERYGNSWDAQDIGNYYDTSNGADLAMYVIMKDRILANENKSLSQDKFDELRNRINRNTSVSDAIGVLAEISRFAVSNAV